MCMRAERRQSERHKNELQRMARQHVMDPACRRESQSDVHNKQLQRTARHHVMDHHPDPPQT